MKSLLLLALLFQDATSYLNDEEVLVNIRLPTGSYVYDESSEFGKPLVIEFDKSEDYTVGPMIPQQRPVKVYDKDLDLNIVKYPDEVTYLGKLNLIEGFSGPLIVSGQITGQICDELNCTPIDPPIKFSSFRVVNKVNGPSKFALDWPFILAALSGGVLALLTPCVFPMIPVTVSMFTGLDNPLKNALIYCLTIIGSFTILGVLTSALFGPMFLVGLANSPLLNLFFALIFAGFALMLMGELEFALPFWLTSSIANKRSAIIGSALTFTLVSFTCTFPFLGTILILASEGSYAKPIIGAALFSTAFSSPFFLLALFPSLIKKLPKSGQWMADFKYLLGLAELIFALKFLSVAIGPALDRAAIISGAVSVLLLGVAYFHSSFKGPRSLCAAMLLWMATWLCLSYLKPSGPIWWDVEAFLPEGGQVETIRHQSPSYEDSLESAKKEGKLLFVEFTGTNCANCRKMAASVLSDPRTIARIDDFVVCEVYTDNLAGQELERKLLNTISIPAYAIVDPDTETVLAQFVGMDNSNGEKFRSFLSDEINRN